MRRVLSLLLLLAMLCALAACGQTPVEGETPTADGEETAPTPEPTQQPTRELALGQPNQIGQEAELCIRAGFVSPRLRAPGGSSYYSPGREDALYLVLFGELKNLGTRQLRADKLFRLELAGGDAGRYQEADRICALTGKGTQLQSSPKLEPLEKILVYYAFEIPEDRAEGSFNLRVTAKSGGIYSASFTLTELEALCPPLELGETVEGDHVALTVEDVFYTRDLRPSSPSGIYTHYTAKEGSVFLIVKVRGKNLSASNISYSSLASASCVYAGKYHYEGSSVFEQENGRNLNDMTEYYTLDPLEMGVCYLMISLPEEAEGGPVDLLLYSDGTYYRGPAPRAQEAEDDPLLRILREELSYGQTLELLGEPENTSQYAGREQFSASYAECAFYGVPGELWMSFRARSAGDAQEEYELCGVQWSAFSPISEEQSGKILSEFEESFGGHGRGEEGELSWRSQKGENIDLWRTDRGEIETVGYGYY